MRPFKGEDGSSLPLAIAVVAFGVATLLVASQISSASIAKEKLQLAADSIAWRYSRDALLNVPGQETTLVLAISGESALARVALRFDGKTVLAKVCGRLSTVCATALARSSPLAPRP